MKHKYLLTILMSILTTWGSLCAYELGIVTLFRNEANYLKEWIDYHHMLGVEHFLLYNDRSTDQWEEVLEPYIKSNLVEVFDWHKDITFKLPNGEIMPLFPTWQIMAYKDGLRRSKGNTEWLAFIDVDEFILPKAHKTIIECIDRLYPSASGIYICWRNFGTSGVYIDPGKPILSHLTKASDVLHPRNAAGKSIVKVDDVNIDQIWSPHQLALREGTQYYNGSGAPLYFKQIDLQIDPQHTSDYIQINHYVMRDENFYQNVRLPKAISKEYGQLSLLLEHYDSFNQTTDYQIIEFLQKHYPTIYHTYWNNQ